MILILKSKSCPSLAEDRTRCKYAALAETHQFEPIAVESTGAILRAIGRRLVEETGEPREAARTPNDGLLERLQA